MGVLDFLIKPKLISPLPSEERQSGLLDTLLSPVNAMFNPETITVHADNPPPRPTPRATPKPTARPMSAQGQPFSDIISRILGDQTGNAYATLAGENASLDPKAVNRNRNGSTDVGLFQINSDTFKDFMKRKGTQLKKAGITSYEDMYDPEKNTIMAKFILDEQGWDAWYGSPLRKQR